jgi:hypothetical protein
MDRYIVVSIPADASQTRAQPSYKVRFVGNLEEGKIFAQSYSQADPTSEVVVAEVKMILRIPQVPSPTIFLVEDGNMVPQV